MPLVNATPSRPPTVAKFSRATLTFMLGSRVERSTFSAHLVAAQSPLVARSMRASIPFSVTLRPAASPSFQPWERRVETVWLAATRGSSESRARELVAIGMLTRPATRSPTARGTASKSAPSTMLSMVRVPSANSPASPERPMNLLARFTTLADRAARPRRFRSTSCLPRSSPAERAWKGMVSGSKGTEARVRPRLSE